MTKSRLRLLYHEIREIVTRASFAMAQTPPT